MSDKKPTEASPTRDPPTIGYLRAQGVTRFRVSCTSINCMRGSDMTFDALGMPDYVPFPSIASRRRWICSHCGCRKVDVMPRWPYR